MQMRSCDEVASIQVLTVRYRDEFATLRRLTPKGPRASHHGISISRSKTSSTPDFAVYPQALTFHFHDRIFTFIVDSWVIEPACLGEEIQGCPYFRSAHPNDRQNQATSCCPCSRNPYKTRPGTTQDTGHAKTSRR